MSNLPIHHSHSARSRESAKLSLDFLSTLLTNSLQLTWGPSVAPEDRQSAIPADPKWPAHHRPPSRTIASMRRIPRIFDLQATHTAEGPLRGVARSRGHCLEAALPSRPLVAPLVLHDGGKPAESRPFVPWADDVACSRTLAHRVLRVRGVGPPSSLIGCPLVKARPSSASSLRSCGYKI